MAQYNKRVDINPFNSITSILVLVVVLIGLYVVASSIFRILQVLSPFLIIGALLLDYKVVVRFGQWLWGLLKRNPVMGVLAILLIVVGHPILSGFLCMKAYLSRKIRKANPELKEKHGDEYIDFEEIDDQPLDLPQMERREARNSEYDDLLGEELK